MTDNPDDLEAILSSARDDVHREVSGVTVPDFSPNRRTGPAVAGLVAVLVLVGGGLFLFGRDNSTVIETDVAGTEDDTPSDTSDDDVADDASDNDASSDEGSQDVDLSGFVTAIDVRVPSDVVRPNRGEPVVDPSFGTTSERVTDAAAEDSVTPVQAPASAFNSDGSMLLLYKAGGSYELYDVESHELISEFAIDASDIEDVFWSPTDPAVVFYANDSQLRQFDVETQRVDVIAEFPDCLGLRMNSSPSWDGNTFALACVNADFNPDNPTLIAYRQDDDSRVLYAATGPGHLLVSASGDRFAFADGNSGDVSIFNAQLEPTGLTVETGGTTAMTRQNGVDVLVTTGFGGVATGSVIAFDLDTGEPDTVIGLASGYPFPPGGTRLGVTAAPFVVVGAPEITDRSNWDVLDGEVLLLDLRGPEPLVVRLAHNRLSPSDEYFQSAFVAVSPDGAHVAYSTDWGLGDRSDTYLVDLRN